MQTIAQLLDGRGYRRGRRQGRAEGLAEGLAEGRREALKALLLARFKTISRDLRARIEKATPEQIDRWFVSAATARSVRSVFSE